MYFSHLGKLQRSKRDGHQQGEMRTPAVRKGQARRKKPTHKHTHAMRRKGLGCRYWHNCMLGSNMQLYLLKCIKFNNEIRYI